MIGAWDRKRKASLRGITLGRPGRWKDLALKKGERFFSPTIYAEKHPLSGVSFISAVETICFSLSATSSPGLQNQNVLSVIIKQNLTFLLRLW